MRFGNLTRFLAVLCALTVSVWSVGCGGGGETEESKNTASDSANDAEDQLDEEHETNPDELLGDDGGDDLDLDLNDAGSGTGDPGLGLEDLDFSDEN